MDADNIYLSIFDILSKAANGNRIADISGEVSTSLLRSINNIEKALSPPDRIANIFPIEFGSGDENKAVLFNLITSNQLLENHVVFGLDDDTNKFLKPSKLLNARAKTAGKYLKPSILPGRITRFKPSTSGPSKGPAATKRSQFAGSKATTLPLPQSQNISKFRRFLVVF